MNVRVRVLFKSPGDQEWDAMRSLAQEITDYKKGVRVFADTQPDWLVAEFTMPTEPQYSAVGRVDRAIRYHADMRMDSTIQFPLTPEERAARDRKAQRRREKRRAAK